MRSRIWFSRMGSKDRRHSHQPAATQSRSKGSKDRRHFHRPAYAMTVCHSLAGCNCPHETHSYSLEVSKSSLFDHSFCVSRKSTMAFLWFLRRCKIPDSSRTTRTCDDHIPRSRTFCKRHSCAYVLCTERNEGSMRYCYTRPYCQRISK